MLRFLLPVFFLAFAFVNAAAAQNVKKKSVAGNQKAAVDAKKHAAAEHCQVDSSQILFTQISFAKIFLDSTGKYFFTYPAAMPSVAALHELQKNFIRQKFGEDFSEHAPVAALTLYKTQHQAVEFLKDEVYFPLPGIVQFSTYSGSSSYGTYAISDGKKIELQNMFNKGWEQEVTKLIISEFLRMQNIRTLVNYDYTQNENDFIPTSAKLGHDGLEFFYPVNKIASHAVGEQLVFLSWSTLKPYLNTRSAIYSKIKF
jgi:hypothetical protein